MNEYRSGAHTSIQYAYEDPDAWSDAATAMDASDETYVAFGQGIETSASRSNNKVRNFGVGQRNAQSTSLLGFTGSLTVNGGVNNFYWLLGVLGKNVDAGSSPDYTHTYSEADSLASFTAKRPIVFSTEKYEQFQGCLIDSCSITAAVNEILKFSIECPFRYSTVVTGTTSIATDTSSVFTFAGGVIELPDGTTIAAIQNFELTMKNNVEMVSEVGSRFAKGYVVKNREYDFSFTAAISDFSLLGYFYNGSTGVAPGTTDSAIASLILTFTNQDGDTAVFTFANAHINEETLPTNATDLVKEDITGWANSLTSVIYTNSTELAPAEADNA